MSKPTASEKRYLDFVDSLPCKHCQTPMGVTHHHIIGVDKMGITGGKAPHFATMPLCDDCHGRVHRDSGKGWPQTRWMIETLDKAIEEGVIEIK